MKYGIIGSRQFKKLYLVRQYVIDHLRVGDILVSGGAIGPDKIAENTAESMGLTTMIFNPECDKYPINQALMIRNKDIVDTAEFVVAFWDGKSSGTANAIDYARTKGKPIQIIFEDSKSQDGAFANLI